MKQFPQKQKLFYGFSITVLVVSLIYICIQYSIEKKHIYNTIEKELQNAANSTALLFGDEFHKDFTFDKKISEKQNIKNAILLSSLTDKSDIIYVYTFVKKDDTVYFTSSSATQEERDKNGYTSYLEKYEGATQKLKDSFENHKTYYGEVTDKWGTFRSILIPRKVNDIWYVVGADIEISFVEDLLFNTLITYVMNFLFFLTIIILFFKSFKAMIKEENKEELQKQKLLQEQTKLAQMGQMIGNISHQWRQPLGEINSVIMLMENDYRKNSLDKDEFAKHTKKIEELTEYMSTTIDDFNNFFKKDKHKEVFKISDAVDKAIFICKNTCAKHNITMKIDIKDDLEIKSYLNTFIQVFIILFQNSKDAMIQNDIQNPMINIIIETIDSQKVIRILDNAQGIDDEYIDNIFEPYFTTKFKAQGIGIGLYMAKMIIETNMGGKLSVSNQKNGAEFKIVL